ncbi:hypothetical protein B0A49_10189 [Cryomyces minteri]|uniref:Rapamycin-insensitive companion of mTOR domain-containing protein n=1 Tax=Cryomyces minteri TaxID=331657 RepID=A0A4U0WQ57_9PEZI|nr:hypothetical protein B0A49_10189 [Cryomyces minteri]
MDVPSRRKLLRSGYELGLPFAAFTEPPTSHLHEEKLKANAKVIAALFRSWPGIITLSMHDFLAVRSIVSALCITVAQSRNVLLELFFDILRIKPPSWSSSFLAGRRLTTYGRVTNMKTEGVTEPSQSEHEDRSGRRNLVEHFTAIILVVLLHAGLIQALLQAQKDAPNLASRRKTTLLLGEVLKLADQLLPSAWSADMQVLPDLFSTASTFVTEDRFEAVNAIYQVDSVNRTLYRSSASSALQGTNQPGTNDSTNPARPADTPKTQISTQIDEAQFRSLMLESQVLNSTNYTKWRWDLIQPMIEGPLLNPKRLDEAIKATKFIHRLCGFFRPFKYRFSDVKNTKPNQRYVRAGVALVRSLLQNPEGVKYLAENKMLRQVAECLAQLDRMSGIVSSSPLFSPERLAETLVGGYFAMLGALGSDPKGLQMMERWKIINMFYHIIELPGRDELIRAMLSNLDFTLDSHPRIILSKAMTSCSKPIRIFSTRLLRKYAIHAVQTSEVGAAKTRSAEWAIRLLVTQLYDPEIEVCEIAIKVLEEACNQTHYLEYVIKCRPALDHLGDIGAPLLLRFLSTSVGYHYLDGLDYISKEMDDWFLGRNDTYVALVEASLSRAFADIPEKTASSLDDAPEHQDYGVAPPHFYRELTRTAEGCKLLEEKGHFEEFASTIREFYLEDEDSETILKVKGCLWAVGNVGSMELGAPFLEQTGVVEWIVKIAETSEVMTMRGTAVFVLGLISRSLHGQEILAEYHWDGKVNIMGESLGYCIPGDFQKLFSMKPWTASSRLPKTLPKGFPTKPVMTDADPFNAEILKLVTNLGNAVLSNRAAADLSSLKSRKTPGFQKPELFHKVMAILSSHHYRLPVCRFVIDLFDKSVMRRIVLDEEDSDSDGSETHEGVVV